MEEYKPNSNRFKEAQKDKEREKKVEKIVTGTVKTKKKSGIRKLTDEFISDDAKNVKSYVLGEVLIPAIKKAISDIVTDGIDMILYGESRKGGRRSRADGVSYTNYSRDTRSYRSDRSTLNSGFSYDDIILDSRVEAQDVLDRMDELINSYQLVTVADLYDLVGMSTTNYMTNKYGWTNIRNAEIVRVREGYWIKMPRAIPID